MFRSKLLISTVVAFAILSTISVSIFPGSITTVYGKGTNLQDSSWPIYRNSILGYEISYPPDWRLGESMSMGYPYVTFTDPILQTKLPEEGLEVDRGAFIEISAEAFRATVPANEYLKNFARTDRGPDGRWLDVETEEYPSIIWGPEGYHLVHNSGDILQHVHAVLVPYPEGSLLLQIRITFPDSESPSVDPYLETFNQMLASLKFTPPTILANISPSVEEAFNLTPNSVDAEIGTITDDHFLTMPFFSHSDMHIQQGWIYQNGQTHYGIDYIKGTIDQSPWETFDVLAAYDGKACSNCAAGPTGSQSVWIEHDVNGQVFYSYYGHLASIESSIPSGDKRNTVTVKRGQKIGTAGSTGVYDTSGSAQPGWVHLHFEVKNSSDVPVDPYDLRAYRNVYFPNSTYTSMGPDHLFTSDPPSYFGGSSDVSHGAGPTVDVVEIIDSSGSMSWNDPYGQRRNAAKTYVDTSIEGDFVGIVDFDGSARLAIPLVKIPENRQSLFSAIDTIDSSGGTNLGAGLQVGCDALINSGSSNAKKGAIFLTDGQGSYSGQATCYSSRGWPIFAFGLEDADDTLLSDIAASTGGEYKRLPTSNLACEFQRVRSKISGINASPCQSAYISPFQHIFYLLRVLSRQAQITMSTSWGGSDVEMSLTSPSGRTIDRNTIAGDVVHSVSGTHEVFTIINPEPGDWEVTLFGADVPASGEEVVFGFTSIPSSVDPIFTDVPNTHWAWNYIERIYSAGITSGCGTGPLIYCPDVTVSRAQMAIFLLRGMHGSTYNPPPVGAGTGFGDVPTNYWAAAWIKQLAAEGITAGCGNGNYCPDFPVTRDQMAVFLLRAEHGPTHVPPDVGAGTGFGDVPSNYWAAAWIKQLAAEGITSGCGSGNFCAITPVSRAQMAVFLVRTFNLP